MNTAPSTATAELPRVARFKRNRWSETRRKIDAMHIGQSLELPWEEYFNANAGVARSNHAYQGTRNWKMQTRTGLRITISREL